MTKTALKTAIKANRLDIAVNTGQAGLAGASVGALI